MRVLVIDPDGAAADELTAELHDAGYDAWASGDEPERALEFAKESRPQVVVGVLETDASEVLSRVGVLLEARAARVAGLLFCGSDAVGLELARALYPGANFTSRATLHTAIASLRT